MGKNNYMSRKFTIDKDYYKEGTEICDDYHITKQDIEDCFDYVIKKVE